jgi:hypothetical protein
MNLCSGPALTCEDGVFFNCEGDPDENHSNINFICSLSLEKEKGQAE